MYRRLSNIGIWISLVVAASGMVGCGSVSNEPVIEPEATETIRLSDQEANELIEKGVINDESAEEEAYMYPSDPGGCYGGATYECYWAAQGFWFWGRFYATNYVYTCGCGKG